MENNLTYTQMGDYLFPNLTIEEPEVTIGKYGMLRRTYLKENRPVLWGTMTMDGTLFSHCLEIEDTANSRLESMMPQLAKAAGATEQLKASDQMAWVGLMNSCKAQAEEIIMSELIYS
nr:TnpV protein [uncultured Oscillibacter sp.]